MHEGRTGAYDERHAPTGRHAQKNRKQTRVSKHVCCPAEQEDSVRRALIHCSMVVIRHHDTPGSVRPHLRCKCVETLAFRIPEWCTRQDSTPGHPPPHSRAQCAALSLQELRHPPGDLGLPLHEKGACKMVHKAQSGFWPEAQNAPQRPPLHRYVWPACLKHMHVGPRGLCAPP